MPERDLNQRHPNLHIQHAIESRCWLTIGKQYAAQITTLDVEAVRAFVPTMALGPSRSFSTGARP